jgi:hypothetical protein
VTPGLAYSGNLYDPDNDSASTEIKGIDDADSNAGIPSDVLVTPHRLDTDRLLNGAEGDILSSFRSARKAIYSSGSGSAKKKSGRGRSESLDEVIADHPLIQLDPLTGQASGRLIASDSVSEYIEIFTAAKDLIALTLPSDRLVSRVDNEFRKGAMPQGDYAQVVVQSLREVALSLHDEIKSVIGFYDAGII